MSFSSVHVAPNDRFGKPGFHGSGEMMTMNDSLGGPLVISGTPSALMRDFVKVSAS